MVYSLAYVLAPPPPPPPIIYCELLMYFYVFCWLFVVVDLYFVICWFIYWLICWLIYWLTGWIGYVPLPVDWYIDLLVELAMFHYLLTDILTYWLNWLCFIICWLIYWLTGWTGYVSLFVNWYIDCWIGYVSLFIDWYIDCWIGYVSLFIDWYIDCWIGYVSLFVDWYIDCWIGYVSLLQLNAWNPKQAEEPDYTVRLDTFRSVMQQLKDWTEVDVDFLLPLIYNCCFFIKNVSSREGLRTLLVKVFMLLSSPPRPPPRVICLSHLWQLSVQLCWYGLDCESRSWVYLWFICLFHFGFVCLFHFGFICLFHFEVCVGSWMFRSRKAFQSSVL